MTRKINMTKIFIVKIIGSGKRWGRWLEPLVPGLAVLALATGCQTSYPFPAQNPPPGTNAPEVIALRNSPEFQRLERGEPATNAPEVITLREGDVLKISFPANPNLNTTQPIPRDGMISMPLVGELKVVGQDAQAIGEGSGQCLFHAVTVEGSDGGGAELYISGLCKRGGTPPGEDSNGSILDRPGSRDGGRRT